MGKMIFRVSFVICLLFVGLVLKAPNVLASNEDEWNCNNISNDTYRNQCNNCIANSGGRGGTEAVKYACYKSTYTGGQNGCSLWIGSLADSVSTTIYVVGTGKATIAYWGMCTNRADTTLNINVTNDNDSIDDNMNLTRGRWNRPTAIATTLDVVKFIEGLTGVPLSEGDQCSKVYTRDVNVARTHSDGKSTDSMTQRVTVIVYDNETCEEVPPPETDLCMTWTPTSYLTSGDYHGTTSIEMKIKNTESRFGGTGYGDWNDGTIYAMPTDTIAWHTCYYPGVQTTAFTEVSSINWQNWSNYLTPLPADTCIAYYTTNYYPITYKQLHLAALAVGHPWENKYVLSGDAEIVWDGDDIVGKSATVGDSNTLFSHNGKITGQTDAGKTFTENTTTGQPIDADIAFSNQSCDVYKCPCCPDPPKKDENGNDIACDETNTCWCCKNTYGTDLANASVSWGPAHDGVSVKVPYNFQNTTEVTVASDMVYAGETVQVGQVSTTVNPIWNGETIFTYATQVPHAQVKLFAYVSNNPGGQRGAFASSSDNGCAEAGSGSKQCMEFNSTGSKTLNRNGLSFGPVREGHTSLEGTYNAYDASAGDYMCFVSAVYPAASNGYTDMSGGNGQWQYSNPDCVVIAKKPSFQVWGGSLYSKGSIDTYEGLKRNIYSNYYNSWNNLNKNGGFKKTGGGSTVIHFTPWVEESLILNTGTTKTVASGAATGKNSNPAGAGNTSDFCKDQAALTFANYSGTIGTLCNGSSSVGQSGLDNGIKDRDALISYWVGGADKGSCGSMWGGTCRNIESASGETIRYVSGGDMSIGTTTIPAATTYLVKSNGTVTITGDLKYQSGYTRLRDIPKVVIYARNVNIQCGVNEVDAIIITGNGGTGKVDTCSNASGGDSAHNRSRQLKIFGMVITDEIELGRTYGNAANKGGKTDPSGMPADGAAAEIFDFDTSILMWSEYMAGSAESDTLETVYQREVAPRY